MKVPPGPVVLDASVAIALVRSEVTSRRARQLIDTWTLSGTELVAPSLLWLEVANALVPRSPSPGATLEALHVIERLGVRTVHLERPLLVLAVGHSHAHGLTPYDAVYLALAESEDGRLATADRALATAAGDRAILVTADSTDVHESPATYGTPPPGSTDADPDAWPGFDRYVAGLREEAKARPSR
jgi:predicted nucleic acid-binding protein